MKTMDISSTAEIVGHMNRENEPGAIFKRVVASLVVAQQEEVKDSLFSEGNSVTHVSPTAEE